MKKIISILALSAFVGISGLSAGVDSSESKTTQTLSKADSEFLFGTNAKNLNVEVLSQKELEETQGEFWNFAKGGVDFVVYFFKKTKENGWWNFRF